MNDVVVTDPTSVDPLGVNPDDVDRCTSYPVTPVSSVDAAHDTVGDDPDPDTPDGTLGAVVSEVDDDDPP